jgi:K+-transporting ATPase c subunit
MIGESQIQGRTLGFIGQERVNVVELNLALDRPAAEMAAGVGG